MTENLIIKTIIFISAVVFAYALGYSHGMAAFRDQLRKLGYVPNPKISSGEDKSDG